MEIRLVITNPANTSFRQLQGLEPQRLADGSAELSMQHVVAQLQTLLAARRATRNAVTRKIEVTRRAA
jgi:hypothetical protein